MNQEILEGTWKQLKGKAKSKWAKLTDDDLDYANGRLEELSGILQKKYGYKKDEADKNLDEFMRSIN